MVLWCLTLMFNINLMANIYIDNNEWTPIIIMLSLIIKDVLIYFIKMDYKDWREKKDWEEEKKRINR